jgi:hypothetical protein
LSQCAAVWLGVQRKLTYIAATYKQFGLDSSLAAIKLRARCQRFVPANIFVGKSFLGIRKINVGASPWKNGWGNTACILTCTERRYVNHKQLYLQDYDKSPWLPT